MTEAFGRISVIASNTFRESVRNKAFIFLMLASLALLFSSLLLAELAVVGQEKRLVQDFGLYFISLMGVVIAITSGVILVYKELDKKTIYTVLARPLHRWEFILGKYLGMLQILIIEICALAALWFIILFLTGIPFQLVFVKAVLLMFGEWMIISAVALLFSSFSTPILSGVLSFAIFMVGRVTYIIQEMLEAKSRGLFVSAPGLRPFGEAIVRVFPDLSIFNISKEILLGQAVEWTYVLQAYAYGLSYVVILVALAVLLFQRRDFV